MIIEFFGLPGAGKTTICTQLCKLLRTDGYAVLASHEFMSEDLIKPVQFTRRLGLISTEYLRGRPSGFSVKRALSARQASRRDKLKSIFNFLTVNALIARANRTGEALLLDQGIVQAVWSWRLRMCDLEDDAMPFAEWPRDYALIILEADTDVIKHRLGLRKNNHSRLFWDVSCSRKGVRDSHWRKAITLFEQAKIETSRLQQLTPKRSCSFHSTTDREPEEITAEIYQSLDCS